MKEKNNTNDSGYGLFSLIAMIVGIIIGSGIFVKNGILYNTNSSVILSMISWLIGGLIVLAMILAFLEIFSITEITNEQSTIGNWSRHLLGEKTGKILGYYYTMIYQPLSIVVIAMFGSNEFMKALSLDSMDNPINKLMTTIGITIAFLIMLFSMNAFFTKPGKIFQNTGTIIKTIPLFFIIILFVGIMIFNFGDLNPIFNSDFNEGITKQSSLSSMNVLLISIPPVLFSFDGFLSAGSLSKDTKKKNTFRVAVCIGLAFVAAIYLLFSISTFALGDKDDLQHSYGSIQNVIYARFSSKTSAWLAPLLSIIITISITTAVSGTIIGTSKLMTDLSATNSIKDTNGRFLKRNKYSATPNSTLAIAALASFWFLIVNIMNIIFVVSLPSSSSTFNSPGTVDNVIPISDFVSDLLTVGAFASYTLVIFGGIINRFTNKVEVKKQKGFLFYAIFTTIIMSIVTVYFAYSILVPGAGGVDTTYILKLSFTLLFIVLFIGISLLLINKGDTLTKDELKKKDKIKNEYFYIEQE